VRDDVKTAIAQGRAMLKEEQAYQREIKRIESRAKKKERLRSTSAERRQESDDAVRHNIPEDLRPLFERVKRSIKGSDRESRTEAFLKYAEENPGEVAAAIAEEAEREIARLQREEAKEYRRLRGRGVSAAELADVPF
jgi:predicted transcriptional regulator